MPYIRPAKDKAVLRLSYKIREGYLTLAHRENTILIEVGGKTIDEICEKILSYCA